jgi:hypothetical protein
LGDYLDAALAAIENALLAPVTRDTCGQAPCVNPSFCRTSRAADERLAQQRQQRNDLIPENWDEMSIDALSRHLNSRRPTPQSTIEAILHCVRERGLKALKEPANIERLRHCDAAAITQIDACLVKIK